jgi:hypothetical protein
MVQLQCFLEPKSPSEPGSALAFTHRFLTLFHFYVNFCHEFRVFPGIMSFEKNIENKNIKIMNKNAYQFRKSK